MAKDIPVLLPDGAARCRLTLPADSECDMMVDVLPVQQCCRVTLTACIPPTIHAVSPLCQVIVIIMVIIITTRPQVLPAAAVLPHGLAAAQLAFAAAGGAGHTCLVNLGLTWPPTVK
jgi:hypothetical protein